MSPGLQQPGWYLGFKPNAVPHLDPVSLLRSFLARKNACNARGAAGPWTCCSDRAMKAKWQAAAPRGGASWALHQRPAAAGSSGWSSALSAGTRCCQGASQAAGLCLAGLLLLISGSPAAPAPPSFPQTGAAQMVPLIQGCGRGRAAGGADPCSPPPASRKQAHGFSFLNLPSGPLSEELQLEPA